MSKRYAFTLSELLIAIVIIGVIAAITVPSVMTVTAKEEHKTRLKKTFSSLSQAINLSYGYYFYDDYRDWNFGHNNQFTEEVYKKLSQHLPRVKNIFKLFKFTQGKFVSLYRKVFKKEKRGI